MSARTPDGEVDVARLVRLIALDIRDTPFSAHDLACEILDQVPVQLRRPHPAFVGMPLLDVELQIMFIERVIEIERYVDRFRDDLTSDIARTIERYGGAP
jgi:hypothetical protein